MSNVKQLIISEATAKRLYKNGSSEIKEILEDTFDKSFFNEKLIETVKTIKQVYEKLDRKMPTLTDYKFLPESKRERALNSQYIDDISELFNEGWKPDFNNLNQYKYYNWFKKVNNAWCFYYCDCYSCGSDLPFGFYFKDKATGEYCGNTFLDIYSKVL